MVFKAQNWMFTIEESTPDTQISIYKVMNAVRYVGYYIDKPRVQGFMYNHSRVSKNHMIQLIPSASWEPVDAKLKDNHIYYTKKSEGLLVEIGKVPRHGILKKTQAEGMEQDDKDKEDEEYAKYAMLIDKCDKFNNELGESRQVCNDLKTQLAKSEAACEDLKTQLAKSEAACDDLNTQLTAACDDLTTQLAAACDDLKTHLAAADYAIYPSSSRYVYY
jgi:hypothetical protein